MVRGRSLWSEFLTVTPTIDGTISVTVAAGSAADAAGNNSIGDTFNFTSDQTAPIPVITSLEPAITSSSSFAVMIDFGETVVGFALEDLTLSNASAADLVDNGNGEFEFTLSALGDGTVTVDIADAVAQDSAGNTSLASLQFSREVSSSIPQPILSSLESDPSNADVIVLQVGFAENVTGLALDDFVVSNATVQNLTSTDGPGYVIEVLPLADGDVSVMVSAGAVVNAASTPSLASATWTIVSDRTAPSVTLSTTSLTLNADNPVTVTVLFDEPVTGFVVSDVTVTNGTATSLTGSMNSYSFEVIPSTVGQVTVTLPAAVAQDEAGNNSLVATPISWTFDNNPTTIAWDLAMSSISESGGNISVRVRRTGGLVGDAEVNWSTALGSAGVTDFVSDSGTISWLHGEGGDKDVVISITDDSADEDNETFVVNLTETLPSGLLGSQIIHTVTILDDDESVPNVGISLDPGDVLVYEGQRDLVVAHVIGNSVECCRCYIRRNG